MYFVRCRIRKAAMRAVAVMVLAVFLVNAVIPVNRASAQADGLAALRLPPVGTMVRPSMAYLPPLAVGMEVHPENPLQFSFIIDRGDSNFTFESDAFRQESKKLVKYFMASLTVPEKEQWVNLSPYEKDRITGEGLGQTDMGRDMLAQDYILKQLSASLFYPEDDLGKSFWQRVYQKTAERFGSTDLPLDTFNKVWIMPDKAAVYEKGNRVFVVEQHLKVMLEQDYLALENSKANHAAVIPVKGEDTAVNGVMHDAVRAVLIPEIEKEVNTGKNFATLRQIYNSMILAVWYKKALRESLLGKVYVDRNKAAGIRVDDPAMRQKLYDRYLASFKAGVYNYIKDEVDPQSRESLPRKYVSGGAVGVKNVSAATEKERRDWAGRVAQRSDASAAVMVDFSEAPKTDKSERNKTSASVVRMVPGAKKLTGTEVVLAVEGGKPKAGMFIPLEALMPGQAKENIDPGVGDLGPLSQDVIKVLAKAGVGAWLSLPTSAVDGVSGSPYYGDSFFASNELSISPDMLIELGLITANEYQSILPKNFSGTQVSFAQVKAYKEALVRLAYKKYFQTQDEGLKEKFEKFKKENIAGQITATSGKVITIDWLPAYAIFRSISNVYDRHGFLGTVDQFSAESNGLSWDELFQLILDRQWGEVMSNSPREIRLTVSREQVESLKGQLGTPAEFDKILAAFAPAWKRWPENLMSMQGDGVSSFVKGHEADIEFFKFYQFLLRQQMDARRQFAHDQGVQLPTDLPIFLRFGSIDYWKNPKAFIDGLTTGEQPDAFSPTGQKWGHRVPDWTKKQGVEEIVKRYVYAFFMAGGDPVRIDYMNGLINLFAMPAAGSPLEGKRIREWFQNIISPKEFFAQLEDFFPNLSDILIAENLGSGLPETKEVMEHFGLKGMGVLQFIGLSEGAETAKTHLYNPRQVLPQLAMFVGTHDNKPTRAWYGGGIVEISPTVNIDQRHVFEILKERGWVELIGQDYRLIADIGYKDEILRALGEDADKVRPFLEDAFGLSVKEKETLGGILLDAGIVTDVKEISDETISVLMAKLLVMTSADMAFLNVFDLIKGEDGKRGSLRSFNKPGKDVPGNWSGRISIDQLKDETFIALLKDLVETSQRSPDNWIERREPVRLASPVAQLALEVLMQQGGKGKQWAAKLAGMLYDGQVRKADLRQGMLSVVYHHTDGKPYILLSRSQDARDKGYLSDIEQAKSLIDALQQVFPDIEAGELEYNEALLVRLQKAHEASAIDYMRLAQDELLREKIMTFLGALVNANILDQELDADTRDRLEKIGLSNFRIYYTERYRALWDDVFRNYGDHMPRQLLIAGILNGKIENADDRGWQDLQQKLPLFQELVATVAEAFAAEIAASTGHVVPNRLAIPLNIQQDIERINREGKFSVVVLFVERDGVLAAHYRITDKVHGTSMEVAPEDGGRVFQFNDGNGDVFAAPLHYGFPIGEVSQKFTARGHEYNLKNAPEVVVWQGHYYHPGEGLPWAIQKISVDEQGAITIRVQVKINNSLIIPGDSLNTLDITLQGKKLMFKKTILNKGASSLQDLFGIHPWFHAGPDNYVTIQMEGKHVSFSGGVTEELTMGTALQHRKILTQEKDALNDTYASTVSEDGYWYAWLTSGERQIIVKAASNQFPFATVWTQTPGVAAIEPTASVRNPFGGGVSNQDLQRSIGVGEEVSGDVSLTVVTKDDIVRLARAGKDIDAIVKETGASQEFVAKILSLGATLMPFVPLHPELVSLQQSVEHAVTSILSDHKPEAGLSYLRSFMTSPTGQEAGYFIATDWGGTNLRVVLVHLVPGKEPKVLDQYTVSGAFEKEHISGVATIQETNDFVAGKIAALIANVKADKDADPQILSSSLKIGAGFSFETVRMPDGQVKLVKSGTKGWAFPGVSVEEVGEKNAPDIIQLLQGAIGRNVQLKDLNLKVVTVPNDTVAVGLANKDSNIALVVGTGLGVAVKDPKIDEWVTLDLGFFKDIPKELWTTIDQQVFDEVDHDVHKLEKMVSGKYLIELLRRLVKAEILKSAWMKVLFNEGDEAKNSPMAGIDIDSRLLTLAADTSLPVPLKIKALSET
ncbi:MAG: 4-alpha-glucanotransferase, partial [Candidatus Omnitrophota bacterium]